MVTLAEIAQNGEQYESELIRVFLLSTDATGNFAANTTYQIADPSDSSNAVTLRVGRDTDSDAAGVPIPDVFNFVGVLGQFSSSDPAAGYQLNPVLATDIDTDTRVADRASELPTQFALLGNYPNPFNPSTTISFDLPWPAKVSINIFDLQGRRVLALPAQTMKAGAAQTMTIDAASLATGPYFYLLKIEGSKTTLQKSGRIMLLK